MHLHVAFGLSVCLLVTLVDCAKTAKDIVRIR